MRAQLFGTPPAYPNEAASSWTLRVADDHEVSVDVLFRAANAGAPARDLDFCTEQDSMRKLCRLAGVSPRVFSLCQALRTALSLQPDLAELVLRGDGGNPYFAYCPRCLSEPATSYFPIEWRLRFFVLCPIHSLWLQHRCRFCKALLTTENLVSARSKVSRASAIRPSVTRCPVCRCSLDKSAVSMRVNERAKHRFLASCQRAALSSIVSGNAGVKGIDKPMTPRIGVALCVWAHHAVRFGQPSPEGLTAHAEQLSAGSGDLAAKEYLLLKSQENPASEEIERSTGQSKLFA